MVCDALGGRTVAISSVVAMMSETYVFVAVAFSMFSLRIAMPVTVAPVEPRSLRQWISLCESDNSIFLDSLYIEQK